MISTAAPLAGEFGRLANTTPCTRTGASAAAHGIDAADAATDAQQGAPLSGGNERQSQQRIMKGFDKIEVFSGGEEQWQNWSWKIKTAGSGLNEELAEMQTVAEWRC